MLGTLADFLTVAARDAISRQAGVNYREYILALSTMFARTSAEKLKCECSCKHAPPRDAGGALAGHTRHAQSTPPPPQHTD